MVVNMCWQNDLLRTGEDPSSLMRSSFQDWVVAIAHQFAAHQLGIFDVGVRADLHVDELVVGVLVENAGYCFFLSASTKASASSGFADRGDLHIVAVSGGGAVGSGSRGMGSGRSGRGVAACRASFTRADCFRPCSQPLCRTSYQPASWRCSI